MEVISQSNGIIETSTPRTDHGDLHAAQKLVEEWLASFCDFEIVDSFSGEQFHSKNAYGVILDELLFKKIDLGVFRCLSNGLALQAQEDQTQKVMLAMQCLLFLWELNSGFESPAFVDSWMLELVDEEKDSGVLFDLCRATTVLMNKFQECQKILCRLALNQTPRELVRTVIENSALSSALTQPSLTSAWAFCDIFSTQETDIFFGLMTVFGALYALLTPTWTTQMKKFTIVSSTKSKPKYWNACQEYFSKIELDIVRLNVLEYCWACLFCQAVDVQRITEESGLSSDEGHEGINPNAYSSSDQPRTCISAVFAIQDKLIVKSFLVWMNEKLSELSETTVSLFKQRHRRLMKYVSEGLWRLELIQNHQMGCNRAVPTADLPWYQSNSDQESATRIKRSHQRKNDRERKSSSGSSTQRWSSGEGSRSRSIHSPPYRPRMGQCNDSGDGKTNPVHQGLIPRLLASPAQLLTSCMAQGEQAEAVQVARLYDLWETDWGHELRFSRAFSATVQRLSQLSSQHLTSPVKVTVRQKSDSGSPSGTGNHQWTPKNTTMSRIREATSSALRTLSLTATVDSLVASETPPRLIQSSESEGLIDDAFLISCDMACQAGIPWSSVLTLLQSIGTKLQNTTTNVSSQSKFAFFFNTLRRWQKLVTTLGEITASHAFAYQLIPPSQVSFLAVPYADSKELQALADWLDVVNKELNTNDISQNSSKLFFRLNEGLVKYLERSDSTHTSNQYVLQLSLYVSIVQALSSTDGIEGKLNAEPCFIFELDVEKAMTELMVLLPEVPPALAKGIQILGMTPAALMLKRCWPNIRQTECSCPMPKPWLQYLRRSCPILASLVEALDEESKSTIIHRYRKIIQETGDDLNESLVSDDDFPHSPELEETAPVGEQLGHAILASLDTSLREKLSPLVNCPLLLLEQLLMNEEISSSALVLKATLECMSHSNSQGVMTAEDFEILILEYAAKALDVVLPNRVNQVELGLNLPVKSEPQSESYILPSVAPPREEWVPDMEVLDCMCCKTTRFSMFHRRHHCRRCGRVVCSTCSPYLLPILPYAPLAVRICIQCHHAMEEGFGDNADKKETKSLSDSTSMTWKLYADDSALNALVRRDFSYEFTPSLTLALSLVDLLSSSSSLIVGQFLLDQSTKLLAFIRPSRGQSEVDPGLILHLVRSLLVAAKLRYATAVPPTSKVHSGIQSCEARLSQVDLYTVLISAQCLHLLPAQALHSKDAGRQLCAALVREELWSLSLDLSTKCGLDPSSIWASWGLVYLRAGRLQAARQRLERCLRHNRSKYGKETQQSPVLNEVISTLENLALEVDHHNRLVDLKDTTQENVISTSHLERIVAGRVSMESWEAPLSSVYLEEAVYYLTEYGKLELCLAFMAKYGKWRQGCQLLTRSPEDVEAFYHGFFLPALRLNMIAVLVEEMRRSSNQTDFWKTYIEYCYTTADQNGMRHSLLVFQEVLEDWLGATITATSKLFCTRPRNLDELLFHEHYVEEGLSYLDKLKTGTSGLYQSNSKVSVAHLEVVLKLQKRALELWKNSSSSQLEENVYTLFTLSRFSSLQTYIPTLVSERNGDCELVAVLLLLTDLENDAYPDLAYSVCVNLGLDCYVIWSAACEIYVTRGQLDRALKLISNTRSNALALSSQELDTLVMDLLKTAIRLGIPAADVKAGLGLVQRINIKIQCMLDLGWFKAAYLEAVRANQLQIMEMVLEQALSHQQDHISTLCQRWLEKRIKSQVSEGALSERTSSTLPLE